MPIGATTWARRADATTSDVSKHLMKQSLALQGLSLPTQGRQAEATKKAVAFNKDYPGGDN